MKRFFLAILCFSLLLSAVSCTPALILESETITSGETLSEERKSTEEKCYDKSGFTTGYARVDVTPKTGVPLAGYGNTSYRRATIIQDRLYCTCVAMSDGKNILLFITNDLIRTSDEYIGVVQKRMKSEFGIPEENIIISATHTHSGPDYTSSTATAVAYLPTLYQGTYRACREAIADLDRSEVYVGKTKTEGLAHVRRYLLADGNYNGTAAGKASTAPLVAHESEADQTMQIIRFDRVNQKDILLVNWRGHPTLTGGISETRISSDYVGVFRNQTEKCLDVNFAYFLDASGNIQPHSRLPGEKNYGHTQIGYELYQVLNEAMADLKKVNTGEVKGVRTTYMAKVNKNLGELNYDQLLEIKSVYRQNRKGEADALCAKYGVSSVYAANSFLSRMDLPDEMPLNLYAFSIGDVSMISAPYEMFDTNSLEVREQTPFEMTFVASCANGSNGYIPSALAFPHYGYEVDTCKFVPGTGEELVREYLALLRLLKTDA